VMKPLCNAVQPICNAMHHSVKHPVKLSPQDFRRFLPLRNQCNRISRCGRGREDA
jgi:hypothetical protein